MKVLSFANLFEKKKFFILMTLWTISVSADWTLGTIYNKSDFVIDRAWHYGMSGKPRTLSSLTKLLSAAVHKHVIVKYHIASQGLALHGHDAYGHEVDIFLDGQPTHSIEWKRKKTQKITHFPQMCSVDEGLFCARVLVQDAADGKYVATPVAMAHDTPTVFNMTILGSKGSYQVTLQEA